MVAEEFAELLTEAWETEEQLAIEKEIHVSVKNQLVLHGVKIKWC